MNEEMKLAWLEISEMLGEPTREELDVFLRTWQRASQATREALAEQPAQQEPVATLFGSLPVYDTSPQPPAQQDIPDLIAGALGVSRGTAYDMMREALAEQPAQQEPVAGLLVGQDSDGRYVSIAAKAHADTLPLGEYKLYTSPPAERKPLTFSKLCDIEYEITHRDGDFSILKFARAIEAAHGIKENT